MILLSLLTALVSHAAGPMPVFLVEFGTKGGGLPVEASLVVFSDRQFVFDSNTGGWERCASPRAGRFKGVLSETDFAALLDDLGKLNKACQETKSCHAPGASPHTAYWVVRKPDGGSVLVSESDHMPKLIGRITRLELQEKPLDAVELVIDTKAGTKAVIRNIGQRTLTLPLGVYRMEGQPLPLSARGPRSKTIAPGAAMEVRLTGAPSSGRIQYDNSEEAHHFDAEGRVFLPCTSYGNN